MATTIERVRLTEPRQAVEAIPYLLGFHPSESLVVLGLRDGRVAVALRVDLDSPEDLLRDAARTLLRHSITAGLLVIWTAQPDVEVAAISGPILRLWERDGFLVPAVLVTDGTVLHSENGVQRLNFTDTPLAAPAVAAGTHPLPSRDALVESIEGEPATDPTARQATATDWLTAATAFHADPAATLPDEATASLLNSLDGPDRLLRDRVLASLVGGEDAVVPAVVPAALVTYLARRARPRDAGIHCLQATSALLAGSSIVAHAALDRVHVEHSLTVLLRQMTDLGTPPQAVAAVLVQVANEAGPLA
ncbi:uncharacterized protein DUF4192 [Motilibacter peucedani]|uniref:Uncharacterized protein DUF4192 n=1 Tax=Motilibacter peucedani TaxID=598650 RepID=A0A420XV72_9ACTN|nr:DUF4192 family protein [Motilibacter peucedani]RKS80650.1 uncharacterized protein DUF4192 [Motilibacter peucedani]